jgi:hypothetical protein
MIEAFNRQIDIQFGPVEVMRGGQLHICELRDRRVPKPWKVGE